MFSVFCVGGAVGNSIVLLTSILSFSQDFAFLLGAANVIFFLAMSGGFVPYPYMESWIVWLQWISPIKYSFQAFTWSLLSGTSTAELLDQLELNTPPNVSMNLVILVGIFCLCSACSIVALSRQKEVRWSILRILRVFVSRLPTFSSFLTFIFWKRRIFCTYHIPPTLILSCRWSY